MSNSTEAVIVQLVTSYRNLIDTIYGEPWHYALSLLFTVVVITRLFTQVQPFFPSSHRASIEAETKSIPRLSYWLPYVGNTPLFSLRSQSWLLGKSSAYRSSAFTLNLLGHDYIAVTSPKLLAKFADPSTPASNQSYNASRSRRFFGNRYVTAHTQARILAARHEYTNSESSTRKLIRLLETHAYDFISPSKSWVDQAQWERSSNVSVTSTSPTLSVSASFAALVGDFSGHMILSALLGRSFVEANPGFVDDLSSFSRKYSTFMTGLPYWLAPGLGPPALARERCLLILDGLIDAMLAETEGKSMIGAGAGMLYELDDVNVAIWQIVQKIQDEQTQAKTSRRNVRAMACEVLELIWHITFESTNMVVWILIHLSINDPSNRIVLETIRKEITNVLTIEVEKPTGLPFKDPPRLRFRTVNSASDGPLNIGEKCPLLQATYSEVRRLEMEHEDYLVVTEDFILQAAQADKLTNNTKFEQDATEKFQLRKGDRIYAAYGATNKDGQTWDRPRRFVPSRFILSNGQDRSKSSGSASGGQNSMRLTGVQNDVLCIVAALLSFYDFKSADGSGLEHPGARIIAGVGVPKNMKATISRRNPGQ